MTAVTTVYARGPVTIAEWEALPDDGNRYELIDGAVYVNAMPALPHQAVVARLLVHLANAAPAGLLVLPPIDFVAGEATVLAPDLVVVPASAVRETRVHIAPLLVVEVASPSTRRYDRVTKLAAYERGGVGAYWIVDPDDPSVLVFEREGDRLAERARVVGDEAYAAEVPFAVIVVPSALVADL